MKNKKHLYYFNWALDGDNLAALTEDLKEHLDTDEIILLQCNGILKPCFLNANSLERYCKVCQLNVKQTISNFKNKISIINIEDFCDEVLSLNNFKNLNIKYNSIEEIKLINYKNISIGYGALSGYVTNTRNREPLINEEFVEYFDRLLFNQVMFSDSIEKIINKINPEKVTFFNGRTADVRPLYDYCFDKKINTRSVEIIKNGEELSKTIFENSLPQNIIFNTNRINETWNKSTESENEKINVASVFYDSRRNSKLVRDVKVYTDKQIIGELPGNWNVNKKNIVIFNSSEDEFAALGLDFDKYFIFENQEVGIEYILSNINDDTIHFYLRIHPNLGNVSYGYHKRLLDFEKKYDNITIIPAYSSVSTYSLIEHSNKVIVFGSTAGVEATFFGKPVILLGGAFYYFLDVAYVPKSISEIPVLISAELAPKNKLGAYKYGYYLMNYRAYSKEIKLKRVKLNIFGKTLYSNELLNIWGSPLLYNIKKTAILTWGYIFNKIIKTKNIIPQLEK